MVGLLAPVAAVVALTVGPAGTPSYSGRVPVRRVHRRRGLRPSLPGRALTLTPCALPQ